MANGFTAADSDPRRDDLWRRSAGYLQNSTVSLADDVAATRRVIDELDMPVTLVGHSYAGVVITEAGNHRKVNALVYIAAFAPDDGESVAALIKDPAPGAGLT